MLSQVVKGLGLAALLGATLLVTACTGGSSGFVPSIGLNAGSTPGQAALAVDPNASQSSGAGAATGSERGLLPIGNSNGSTHIYNASARVYDASSRRYL